MKEVEKHSGEDVTVMVLANKADCAADELEVSEADIKKFEEENKLKVMKVSAKSGLNVDESFLEMTKKLIVKKNSGGGAGADDKKKALGLKKLKDAIDGGNGSGGSSGQRNALGDCCN
jgi:GTPase SAR1 family protein